MNLLDTVRHSINKHDLINPGSIVIVGVSGGPDSLCLLHVLNLLAPEYNFHLHVAHLNHQLRGSEADSDAGFVQSLAEQWKLPFTIESRDVAAFARENKLSIEEAARQVRYGFFIEVAMRQHSDTIAVAHNADDQTESVLMHFLRGSGLGGLRGMLPKTRLEEYRLQTPEEIAQHTKRRLYLIRPLLEVPREAIEEYCQQHNLQPRMDASNADTTYFRNRLRHEMLPALENAARRAVVERFMKAIVPHQEFMYANFQKDSDIPQLEGGIGWAERGDWKKAQATFNDAAEAAEEAGDVDDRRLDHARAGIERRLPERCGFRQGNARLGLIDREGPAVAGGVPHPHAPGQLVPIPVRSAHSSAPMTAHRRPGQHQAQRVPHNAPQPWLAHGLSPAS